MAKRKNSNFHVFLKFFNFQFFHVTPLNFPHLIAKTASPGPIVSVPTPGSWEYGDFICKMQKTSWGGTFSVAYVIT